MIETFLVGLWLMLVAGRGTPIGRALDRAIVRMPADRLSRIGRGHVLLIVLLALIVGAVFWLLGHEGLRLMSLAAPEIASWLTMVEISAYLDAVAAVLLAASTVRLRAVGAVLRRAVGRRQTASRARRTRRAEHPAASNDDEDRRGRALAA